MVHKTIGCPTCKKRKLKCDLSRPGCQRCHRIGKVCPGYPDESDLTFRSENEVVYAKIHTKNERAHSRVLKKPGRLPECPSWSSSSVSSRSASPQNVFLDDVQEHAIQLFFSDYVVQACHGICEGYLHFLPELFASNPGNVGLHNGVMATAYANLSHKTGRKDLQLKATSFYQTSLETVNKTLSDPALATSDATMTAVIMLGLYHCMNNGTDHEPLQTYYTHSEGLSVLADLRGSLLLRGKGPTLLQISTCQIQRKNIDLKCYPSSGDERLVKLLDTSSPASRMVLNMFDVSKYQAKTYEDIQFGDQDRILNNEVIHRYEELNGKFLQWTHDAMFSIPFQTAPSSPGEEPNSTSETRHHIYRGFWSASIWNKHRASWMKLHMSLLVRLEGSRSSFKTLELRRKTTLAIQRLIDEILASVPFSLGDLDPSQYFGVPKRVGAYFLVWALRVVIGCSLASEYQHEQAAAIRSRITRQFGMPCCRNC